MFMQDLDGVFDKMIDTVYKETSRHLLHILHTKYKFMDHLKVSMHCTPYCDLQLLFSRPSILELLQVWPGR